jgi:hypothetical protein
MTRPLLHYRPVGAVPRPMDETVLFLLLFAAYVALLSIAVAAQSGLIKALANVFALVVFGVTAFAWVTRHLLQTRLDGMCLALLVYLLGIGGSLIVNRDVEGWGDLLKVLLGPAFILMGSAFEASKTSAHWRRTDVRVLFLALVVLPLLVLLVQVAQAGVEFLDLRGASIFANRNNAGLYAITLLGLYMVLAEKPIRSIFLFVAVGIMFGTLGLLFAVIIALMALVATLRDFLILCSLIALCIIGYFVFPEVLPFSRITPVVDSVKFLLEGRINLFTVTFAELVLLLRTSDLSFLFRLKHWVDLFSIFSDGSAYNWLFGFGIGSSVRFSEMGLVPHNDYVRYLFEFGLVTLAGFVSILVITLRRCGRRWETIPLLTVIIYFFSENLITNYTAMAFFYFAAGALSERFRPGSRS